MKGAVLLNMDTMFNLKGIAFKKVLRIPGRITRYKPPDYIWSFQAFVYGLYL